MRPLRVASAPAMSKGVVYASYPVPSVADKRPRPPEMTHAIAAFDLKTGEILWQRWIDSDVISAPVVSGDELWLTTFAGTVYKLERPSGFLRTDAPPPVIVGGFGPRMAAIAGKHGDGFNTQAMHPRLADLVRIARDEHRAAGRDPARFIVTVFAGMDDRWLRPDSRARQSLDRAGVERLILLLEPPFDAGRIRQAGRALAGA